MSTGWPPFRYRFSTTLQSGTVFYQKKVENGSTVEPKQLHSGTVFLKRCQVGAKIVPPQRKRDRFQNGSTFDKVVPFFTFFFGKNGSTVEPKRFHSGAKTAPLSEKWYRFQPFFGKLWKTAPLWSRFGKRYHFGQRYRFFLKHDY